jgi:ribonuclease BN (tRNA processing enzyme)
MNIRILGAHNGESQTTSCVCFLIDDALAVDAGCLTSKLTITEQRSLEAVLLTHQHYDHIRDIPSLALNLCARRGSVSVYATSSVRAAIETHLLNGEVYPKFQTLPSAKPAVSLREIEPYEPQMVNGHSVMAVPVKHVGTTVGYQISDRYGKAVFYTGDTGPGLADCWEHVSPQMLIADVTMPDSYETFVRETGHLTPNLLREELVAFKRCRGYLPRVVAVHMDGGYEAQIRREIAAVAGALGIEITVAEEGMQLSL